MLLKPNQLNRSKLQRRLCCPAFRLLFSRFQPSHPVALASPRSGDPCTASQHPAIPHTTARAPPRLRASLLPFINATFRLFHQRNWRPQLRRRLRNVAGSPPNLRPSPPSLPSPSSSSYSPSSWLLHEPFRALPCSELNCNRPSLLVSSNTPCSPDITRHSSLPHIYRST